MADHYQGSILVVDDEADLRFILTAHLKAAGFEVFETVDGAAAIKAAIERQPDLILMDIGLPVLDGIAATRELKSNGRTAHIPVIMLTARTRSEDVVRGLDAGAQEYLLKPFDLTELLARVRTVHRLSIAHRNLDLLNTQLEAEVSLKTRRLQVLNEFMRELNRADNRDRILDLLVQCVERATGASRISLFLREPDGEQLVCQRAVGIDPAVAEQIRLSDVEGITGQVYRSGKTLAAKAYGEDVGAERRYSRDAFLSTPLVSTSLETQDGVIGVINLTDKLDDAPFSEDEIECIRSVADAAAIALDNVTRRMRLQESVRVLLQTLGHLAEYRDEETTLHIDRVTKMARILAEAVQREGPYAAQVTDEFVEMLVQAAPMHDIGKVGIPDEILTKPGKLTEEEFRIMKTHTDIGRRVLSRALDPACPNPLLGMCIDIAHAHHERFNGKGYPQRLSGREIPLAARIIALVDAYDAITSRRRYKDARSHAEAAAIVRAEAGEHFDPVLVDAFLRCHEQFNQVRERYDDSLETLGALSA